MSQNRFEAVATVVTGARKFKDWLRKPMNGTDPVGPFSRQYLSTGVSLAVIVFYRGGEALYNFVTSCVFDGFAYLVTALVGIAGDLWHANPSYSRWVARGALSVVASIGTCVVIVAKVVCSGVVGFMKQVAD